MNGMEANGLRRSIALNMVRALAFPSAAWCGGGPGSPGSTFGRNMVHFLMLSLRARARVRVQESFKAQQTRQVDLLVNGREIVPIGCDVTR